LGTRAPIPHLPGRRDAEEAAGRRGGDLSLLFLMLLMAKKATWSFLPFARRDPPPLPTSFRTCLLHPQQEADLVVFLETEGISSLFSSPPLAVFVLFYLISWSREEGRKRKERNPTRPWGFSSQHPRHPLPLKKTEGSGRGIGPTADILGGRAGSSARTERLHAGGFPFCWVFPPFSLSFFFLFLPSFFFLFSACPPTPTPAARGGEAESPARGAGRGAGVAAEELGRICTFGGRWRVLAAPGPRTPKSVR